MPYEDFDPLKLISNNTNFAHQVYREIRERGEARKIDVERSLGIMSSPFYNAIERLEGVGLVERVDHGLYAIEDGYISPETVEWLNSIRSPLRYEMARYAVREGDVTAPELAEEFDIKPSNARLAANKMTDAGILEAEKIDPKGSYLFYSITEKGAGELEKIEDVERYLDGPENPGSTYRNGIDGSEFRSEYQVQDSYVIREHGPLTLDGLREITTNPGNSTRKRLKSLLDRGILDVEEGPKSNIYRASEWTVSSLKEIEMVESARESQHHRLLLSLDGEMPEDPNRADIYDLLVSRGIEDPVRKSHEILALLRSAEVGE